MEACFDDWFEGGEEVRLVEVDVKVFKFEPERFFTETAEVRKVLERLSTMEKLGEEYEGVLMPALPCLDLGYRGDGEVGKGMIKGTLGVKGIQSGKRSAIVQSEAGALRLKGCGNLLKGFNVEYMGYPEGKREIRGCCFENTVRREQYMTWLINETLHKYGFITGNLPLHYWQYESDILPSIPKFCGVFRTFGEKRLGSHLVSGISLLLSKIETHAINEDIAKLFDSSRTGSGLVPTIKLLLTTGPLNESLESWTQRGVYHDNYRFLNLIDRISETSFATEAETELSRRPVSDLIGILCQLSFRIGWEVGLVKRVLQDNNISWGYFIDHNPFEPHCNAHCNNFIVLGSRHNNLLAPLDFDMAYRRSEFICTIEGEKFGQPDDELFESWMNSERTCLEFALAGQESMANFQYGVQSIETPLQIAIRDLMVLGFREAFDMKPYKYQWNRSAIEDVIRLCLSFTSNVKDY